MAAFGRPTALPIDPFGTPDRGYATMRVTSPYGWRDDPLNAGGRVFHGGMDIGNARLGDQIIAIGGGTVVMASIQPLIPWSYPSPADKLATWGPSYGGNVTVIDHGGGVFSQYAHQREMRVRRGDDVKAGQLIGLIGESGSAYHAGHLHFGIRDNAHLANGHNGWVDPLDYISLEGDDVLGNETNFVRLPWRARARFDATIRTDTRIDPSTADGSLKAGAEITVIGTREGAVFQNDRTWWIFGVPGKGLRTVHSVLLERLPEPAPPPSNADVKIADALIEAKEAQEAINATVTALEK